jgi:hypothetical protein
MLYPVKWHVDIQIQTKSGKMISCQKERRESEREKEKSAAVGETWLETKRINEKIALFSKNIYAVRLLSSDSFDDNFQYCYRYSLPLLHYHHYYYYRHYSTVIVTSVLLILFSSTRSFVAEVYMLSDKFPPSLFFTLPFKKCGSIQNIVNTHFN